MPTLSRTLAAVGATGLVAAGLVSAAPANATTSSIFQIKVTEVQTHYSQSWDRHFLPERGDSFSFRSDLRQSGKRVGTDAGTCTFKRIFGPSHSPTSTNLHCDVTFHFFNRGKLHAFGTKNIVWNDLVDNSFDVKYPIVSGTSAYDGAGGYVRVAQFSSTRAHLTFRLTGVA